MPKRRDYYNSPHTGNLFKQKQEMREIEEKSFRKKVLFYIKLILILIILVGLIYWLFFSAFFNIKKIMITGTTQIEETNKIEQITQNFLKQKKFLILPNKNIFIFNTNNLISILNYNFDLENVVINKKIPQTLEIQIQHKYPALIWQDNGNYFSVYSDGIIKSKITNAENLELPLVSRGTTSDVALEEKIVSLRQLEYIQKLFSSFNFYFQDLSIKEFVIKNFNSQEIELITSENWKMIFSLSNDAQQSLAIVGQIIEQKIKDRKNLEYIDARIKNKIYYK